MFSHRYMAVLALGAAFLTASSSVAAAATSSEPKLLKPGAKILVGFPGYDEPADERLPTGYRMIQRKGTMQEGEVRLDGKPVQTRIAAKAERGALAKRG